MKKYTVVRVSASSPEKALDGLEIEVNKRLKEIGETTMADIHPCKWEEFSLSDTRTISYMDSEGEKYIAYVTIINLKAKDEDDPDKPSPFA